LFFGGSTIDPITASVRSTREAGFAKQMGEEYCLF
jgi:hypothetical protein